MEYLPAVATVIASIVTLLGAVYIAHMSTPRKIVRAERLLKLLQSIPDDWSEHQRIEHKAKKALRQIAPGPLTARQWWALVLLPWIAISLPLGAIVGDARRTSTINWWQVGVVALGMLTVIWVALIGLRSMDRVNWNHGPPPPGHGSDSARSDPHTGGDGPPVTATPATGPTGGRKAAAAPRRSTRGEGRGKAH